MANKTISELEEYVGFIQGDEVLIISKLNEFDHYVSNKYSLSTLAGQISSDVYYQTTVDISTLMYNTSCWLSAISANVSDAISIIANTPAFISSLISSEAIKLSNDLSIFKIDTKNEITTFVDKTVYPLRYITGLSTLNYYTWIGDDINKLSNDPRYPELQLISDDVIWFDTSDDDNAVTRNDINQLKNLQFQIYRLGLQMKDVYRMAETGIVPGTVINNHKDQLITLADKLQLPEDLLSSDELIQVGIYGPRPLQNNSRYYTLFTPAGFDYKLSSTQINWAFDNYIRDDVRTCILSCISASWEYDEAEHKWKKEEYPASCYLMMNLSPFDASISDSLIYDVKMSSMIYTGVEGEKYLSGQEQINEVIDQLKKYDECLSTQMTQLGLSIGTNYIHENYGHIEMDGSYDVYLSTSPAEKKSYALSIYGDDTCDLLSCSGPTYFWALLNDVSVVNMPLNTNLHWFFLSSGSVYDKKLSTDVPVTVKVHAISVEAFDTETGEIKGVGQLDIVNSIDCVGLVDFTLSTGTYLNDIASKKATLYVESRFDTSVSASREIQFGGKRPASSNIEPTVNAVCVKRGTKETFKDKRSTLYPGEMLFYTDKNLFAIYDGSQFIEIGPLSSSGGGGDVSKDQIKDLGFPYLTFEDQSVKKEIAAGGKKSQYKFSIDDAGHVNPQLSTSIKEDFSKLSYDESGQVGGVYVSYLLTIGKAYCGGYGSSDLKSVSHNFIELVNASNHDINLDEIYIMYYSSDEEFQSKITTPNEYWEYTKLQGVIPAGGSYIIRGAESNPYKNSVIKVDHYDFQWRRKSETDDDYTRSGELIEFSQNNSSFCLFGLLKNVKAIAAHDTTPYTAKIKDGYIDLCGFGSGAFVEGSGKVDIPLSYLDWNSLLFVRNFLLDPSRQANKKYGKHSTAEFWNFIDLNKQERNEINQIQYYANDRLKLKFSPGSSSQKHNFFSNKNSFDETKPNMITVTFGCQATQSSSKRATRCFNWVSVGYYNEYIKFRKVGSTSWTTVYSITADSTMIDDSIDWFAPFHKFYDRFRWTAADGTLVTTHKVILHQMLDAGEYEYFIGRDDSEIYKSEQLKFKVHSDNEVKKFSFIQVTDQQGFNWNEYQAWKAACWTIDKFERPKDFNFTINTGDIAQSGNRPNEWLDYIDGRQKIRDKEEMYTIGNNDLCGRPDCELTNGEDNTSKFNLVNIIRYYVFELDPRNIDENGKSNYFAYIDIDEHPRQYIPIYSLYSFTYGNWHFISLVSEIRSYYSLATDLGFSTTDAAGMMKFSKIVNSKIEDWFIKDLMLFKNINTTMPLVGKCQNCIIFMHEMPFTITTPKAVNALSGNEMDRSGNKSGDIDICKGAGCKLNIESRGLYRISRLLKKLGIRAVIGGHKHTFAISKPIYDAPTDSAGNRIIPNQNLDLSNDPFLTSDCTLADSQKPIVEVLNEKTSSLMAEYLSVSDFSAPMYIMSQATGYKLVSNKELPPPVPSIPGLIDITNGIAKIPWLMSYFPAHTVTKLETMTAFPKQKRPMYIRYDLESGSTASNLSGTISFCAYQINNIYKMVGDNMEAFNINDQIYKYDVSSMTLKSDADHQPETDVNDYMSMIGDIDKNIITISCLF